MMVEKIKELFNLEDKLNQELVEYIIIYLRKSRKDAEYGKDEPIEKTLERHENILQEWSQNTFGRKIPSKNVFREVVSGDTIADRPEMQNVLELIEKDEIKGVLCIEIERLARGNSIDQGVIAQKFQITNTKILTPNKIFDLDDEYDMGYFEDGLHQARKYLLYTKKILARGREQSSKEGKFVGSHPPFGYDKEKLEKEKGYKLVQNKDSLVIRKLYDLYLYEDLGTTNTAKKLNTLGMNSSTGIPWNGTMVRTILNRSEVYAGYIVWDQRKTTKKYVNGEIKITRPLNDKMLITKGRHEPIITEEELKMVKLKRKRTSVNKVKNGYDIKNPLAGIVKCPFCNHNMCRRPYYGLNTHKDTLLCRTLYCENVSSDLDIVEQRILDYLKIKLDNYEKYLDNYNIESSNIKEKLKKEKEQIIKKINSLNSQKQKCCEFLETGTYDEETFKSRIELLNKEIKAANMAIEKLEQNLKNEEKEKYKIAVPKIKQHLENYDKYTIQEKNEALTSIIDVVYYKKTNKGGRWDISARDDFELEIRLKL